jgi:CheY-like chemotaxis protein
MVDNCVKGFVSKDDLGIVHGSSGGAVLRILLVEDEPLIALDLENILERLGHVVVGVAETRDEAVQLAADEGPDAALVDIKLRDGFTGIEVARQLSEDFGLYCAFVTGNPEQVTASGAVIVAKPYSVAAIDAVLQGMGQAA